MLARAQETTNVDIIEARRQSEAASEEVALAERRLLEVEGELRAEVDERREAEDRAAQAEDRERQAQDSARRSLREAAEADERLEEALAESAEAEAAEARARALAEALREDAEEAAAVARRMAREAQERAEAAEALLGKDVLELLATEEETCRKATSHADTLQMQCEEEALAASRAVRAGEARQEQLQRAEQWLEEVAGRSAERRIEAAELEHQLRTESMLFSEAEAQASAAEGAIWDAEQLRIEAAELEGKVRTESMLLSEAEAQVSAVEGAAWDAEELRTEAAELEDRLAAESRRRSLAAREAEAAESAAVEASERRAEALDEAQASFQELRAALDEAAEASLEGRAAREDVEEAREQLQSALRREEQAERETSAEAQALLSELAAHRCTQEALASSEEGLATAEKDVRRARQGEEKAEEARAEATEALELQTALREQADARGLQLEEEAEAAERRAEDSELGRALRRAEMEAEALREGRRELDGELQRQKARSRRQRAGIDEAIRSLMACRRGGGEDSEESPSADGSMFSWSMVNEAASRGSFPEEPETGRDVNVHSLPLNATVLNDANQEISVKGLEKGMRLKSVKSIGAKWGDDLDVDTVVVSRVSESRGHEFQLVRCSVEEDPDARGRDFELTAEHLVLAKRSGIGAWLPTEVKDLKDDDDDFTLLVFDPPERDPLVQVNLQKAKAEARPKHAVMVEFELEDPEGIIFASTDGGPLVALCGTSTSSLDQTVNALAFTRNPKALHDALDEHPCLRACRRAIEAKPHLEPIHSSGARIFVLPSLVDKLLKAIEVEEARLDDGKLKSHHVVASRRLQPFVEAAMRSLPSSARVKLRVGATRPVEWQQVQAAEDYHAVRANPNFRHIQGEEVRIVGTFLEVREAPSESSQPHTVSTTDAHLGPAANPRINRLAR